LRKIKLLHIQLLPLLSGAQNMMLNLLKGLDKEKYDIYVLSKPGGPLVEEIKKNNFHYIPVNSLRRNLSFWDIIAFISMIRIFRKYKFDIIHTHSSKTGFLGRIAGRFARVPKIIHTVHGFPFHRFQPRYVQKLYQVMERVASHFCDKVIFVNNSERELAIMKKIVSPNKAQTIYNGIELPNIKELKSPMKTDKFVIGSVLRFWKQKNVINTVKAAIKVCQIDSKINFVFIGDGEHFDICKSMVKKARLENSILFPGWQNNILDWLIGFDVFLLFSKWEGLPISILEAMSVGLPIIASDIKGNNELVNSRNGYLIPVNDIDKLIQLLTTLPGKKKELINKGEFSIKIVKEKFSKREFVFKYDNLYGN
jgi:glycosyltransferase involved in cell wall biosynthesis